MSSNDGEVITDANLWLAIMRVAADLRSPDSIEAMARVRRRHANAMCATPDCLRSVRRLKGGAQPRYCMDCISVAGTCAVCHNAQPARSRVGRKTCCDSCRKALQRGGNPGKPVKKVGRVCSEWRFR
jgi:hypothetical protein